MVEGLASHFEALLRHWDILTPDPPAVVPLDPPLMGQELQTVLDTRYHGAANASLCLVPSYLPPPPAPACT